MFTKTSYKAFKHKAKKGMMKRVGRVESRPEDPSFKAVLAALEELKAELKDFHFKAHGAARAGKNYNSSLEHFCGSGIKGEGLFNKENLFVNAMSEHFGPSLDQFITVEIPKLEELVVAYKTAKLNFDSTYFLTVKDMKKREISGTDALEEVIKNNANLPALQQEYVDSKKEIINQRNTIKSELENDVTNALSEVRQSSDAQHHQLYVMYLQKRIASTIAICEGKGFANLPDNEQQEEKKDMVEDADIPNVLDTDQDQAVEKDVNDVQVSAENVEFVDGSEKGREEVKENQEHQEVEEPQEVEVYEEVDNVVPKVEVVEQDTDVSGKVLVDTTVKVEETKVEEKSGVEDIGPSFQTEDNEEEEDIPLPPNRKAPSVPNEEISSSPQVLTPPPVPTT